MYKFLILFCAYAFSWFILCGCQSRKGDYVRVLYEAKQFEKALDGFEGTPNQVFLEELIGKVVTDGQKRWRISGRTDHLLETTSSYINYKDRSSGKKFLYVINVKGKLVLIMADSSG